jgi:hypothetical protein
MMKIDEEMKTEFGEFLDEYLTRYNLPAYRRPTARMELFDISVEYCFPDGLYDEEEGCVLWESDTITDELGKIFDTKYAEMTKEVA